MNRAGLIEFNQAAVDRKVKQRSDSKRLDPREQLLCNAKFEALQAAIEEVLAVNGSALIGTKWMHKVVNGDGVYEFRIDNDEGQIHARTGISDPDVDDDMEVDVLVRVFFIFDGQRVILLLSAYDKGEDDSARRQNREIEEAKRRATRHRMRARMG